MSTIHADEKIKMTKDSSSSDRRVVCEACGVVFNETKGVFEVSKVEYDQDSKTYKNTGVRNTTANDFAKRVCVINRNQGCINAKVASAYSTAHSPWDTSKGLDSNTAKLLGDLGVDELEIENLSLPLIARSKNDDSVPVSEVSLQFNSDSKLGL